VNFTAEPLIQNPSLGGLLPVSVFSKIQLNLIGKAGKVKVEIIVVCRDVLSHDLVLFSCHVLFYAQYHRIAAL
jgi:hypothetical protein